MITIRAVREDDFVAWNALWQQYLSFYSEQVDPLVTQGVWKRFLDPGVALEAWLACDATGNLVGFAHSVLHPHTWSLSTLCYLEDLFVAPEFRGQDVGHQLIQFLIDRGKSLGWKRVYWHTDTNNVRARRLYDRFSPADPYVRYTQNV